MVDHVAMEHPHAWVIRHHPEISDAQISKLIGTTKTTIAAIRTREHWNIANITPKDPVTLGLCAQRELAPALTPGNDVSNLAEQVADLGLENLFFVTERCRQIRRDLVLNSGQGIEALLEGV